MKLTVLLLTFNLLQISASVYSQNISFKVENNKLTLQDAIKEIERQTNYRFAYSATFVDKQKLIEFTKRKSSVESFLEEVEKELGLDYLRLENGLIVIKNKEDKFSMQQIIVKGVVTDYEGRPLPGVNIAEKGTVKGVITNLNGEYTIAVSSPDAILSFSYVGFLTEEIEVGGKTSIDVTMIEDIQSLEEVVVVGYGTQKKVSLTGAVASVNTDEIEAIPTTSLSNLLAGWVPGVTISSNSGFVGSTSDILIRGKGTYNNTTPLYVIDGIVSDKTSFDVLAPNEVENISFLKDAASAAIYGARAASGVILVTTKKGKIQKPVFNYKGSYTTQRPTKDLPRYNSIDELEYANDVAETYGNPEPYGPEIFEYFKDKNYELMDYIWRNPSSQQHDLSVNGGTEKLTYYMMVGYNKSLGSFHNTDYSRYNFRSNVNAKINDYLSVDLNLSGNQRVINRFYWINDDPESVTIQDFYRSTFNWSKLWPFYVDDEGNPTDDRINGYPVYAWHPIELLYNGGYRKMTYRNLNGIFRVNLDIPFIKGLRTSFQANYIAGDYLNKNFVKFNTAYEFQHGSTTNPFVPAPVDFTKTVTHNLKNDYENVNYNTDNNNSYQLNWFLNYDRDFGNHNLSGTLVYEQQESGGLSFEGRADELFTTAVDQIYASSKSSDRRWFDGKEYKQARISWAGRLHYEYAGKYIAEFSGRYDGSYIFPEESRWGFFPSFSAAWRISEEEFMQNSFMSNLKLRGSVGTSGNDNVGAFQFQNTYRLGSTYAFGDDLYTGIRPSTPPNYLITWEKSRNYDVGMDFGFFNNKLSGEFNYFYRYSYDILKSRIRVIPATYGTSLSAENYAEMDVRGLEFSLNYRNNINAFNYSIGGNIGWAKDKVIYIDEAEGLESWRSAIGKPLDRLWGYEDYGIIRDQATLDALPEGFTQFGDVPTLGAILFKDIRGENRSEGPDGKIDSNDETWLSDNAIPRINYGINLQGSWKGFSLSVLFQGVGAYDKMVKTLNTKNGGVFQVGNKPYFELWNDRWTPENPDAPYPRAANWSAKQYGWQPSTFWMRNGAYLRLKNLNFAYTISEKLIPADIAKLQLYFNGANLFYISGFEETDPEQFALDSYPLMKSFTFGINVNF